MGGQPDQKPGFLHSLRRYMHRQAFGDEKNLSWIGEQWLFNLRVGVTDENLRLEALVTDLFDDDQYLAGNR